MEEGHESFQTLMQWQLGLVEKGLSKALRANMMTSTTKTRELSSSSLEALRKMEQIGMTTTKRGGNKLLKEYSQEKDQT
jgi:hypothetical protein